MPITDIGRNANTAATQTASYTVGLDDRVVPMNATSGAITATLYPAPGDGAFRQVVVYKTDSSSNAVSVTDGTFTFSLTNQYDAVTCELTTAGVWVGTASFDVGGSGNVTGPASSTADVPALFSGTTGKVIKNSTPTGTGNPVLQTSPTLTTPVIGVATGTSLAATGLIKSSSPTAGIGYATGAGGAQTQLTNKSTTVASNTATTLITMDGAALNAGVIVSFTFTNTAVAATDHILINHESGGTVGSYTFAATPGAGTSTIFVRNATAGNLSEAIVIRVTIIKAVSA